MKTTTNNGVNAANNSNNWKNEVNEIRARLEATKTRSCWGRGVKGFALDLLESYENICEYCENNGEPVPELNEVTLLNGAADWNAYCYGGLALIYDGDIANVLCTPSEPKGPTTATRPPTIGRAGRTYKPAHTIRLTGC